MIRCTPTFCPENSFYLKGLVALSNPSSHICRRELLAHLLFATHIGRDEDFWNRRDAVSWPHEMRLCRAHTHASCSVCNPIGHPWFRGGSPNDLCDLQPFVYRWSWLYAFNRPWRFCNSIGCCNRHSNSTALNNYSHKASTFIESERRFEHSALKVVRYTHFVCGQ